MGVLDYKLNVDVGNWAKHLIGSIAYSASVIHDPYLLAAGAAAAQIALGSVSILNVLYIESDQQLTVQLDSATGTEIDVAADKPLFLSGISGSAVYITNETSSDANVYIFAGQTSSVPMLEPDPAMAINYNIVRLGWYNVRDYGAKGDDTTDDTTAIQNAVTAAGANGTVFFPKPASKYKLTGLITVADANQTWWGEQATLHWLTMGAATIGSLGAGTAGVRVSANDFTMRGLILEGPLGGVYVGNEALFLMYGSATGSRLEGLDIHDCEFLNSGAYGIACEFVDEISLERNKVHDVGYAGMQFMSCNHGWAHKNRIETITPGTGSNMYGLTLTHKSAGYDVDPNAGTKQAAFPFCWDWHVDDNKVTGVAWTGLDMHGGYEITFSKNHTYACGMGIQFGGSSGDATGYAGWDNNCIDNVLDAANEDGTASGYENTNAGLNFGTALPGYHKRVLVKGNIVRNYGVVDSTTTAAFRGYRVSDSIVSDNIVTSWGGYAYLIEPIRNIVANNYAGKLADPADTKAFAFFVDPTAGEEAGPLTVVNNRISAEDGTAARVGFYYASMTSRPILSGNDFSAATVSEYSNGGPVGAVYGPDWPNVIYLTDDDATPTITGLTPGLPGLVIFQYTTPTTITDINLPGIVTTEGQIIVVHQDNANALTIIHGANFKLSGGISWVGNAQNDEIVLMYYGGYWVELSRRPILQSLTTAQKNASTFGEGALVYDTNLAQYQIRSGARWDRLSGWVSGTTAAIATGTAVAHGLGATPSQVLLQALDGTPSAIYANAANATSFAVNFTGAGNHAFDWMAIK